ncbi:MULTISPECIES: VOC family protein [unclassified Amycolatopsis]|uniref:VOC family protein n=1 Tax=unclassified Amycolatopsis TaxID=2618356 RepID=UPI0028770479|nr:MULTISPECIES: VOC family protein [unclassified Amycolatopsis]MDS0135310.1 VOC family protein [Amycolatopsis sp. 505]MDS0140999.1 VOC family protein [Amycolatopsis sp. CM201R]
MAIRLGSTVLNCTDLDTMTRFWCAALDLEPSSEDDGFRLLRGRYVNLSLQRSSTPVSARDQMHLDLYTDDQRHEVDRLIGLGARFVRHVDDDPADDWVVLADPEDNLFCVCAKPAEEVRDPAARTGAGPAA